MEGVPEAGTCNRRQAAGSGMQECQFTIRRIDYASTHKKSFYACFYAIVLHGIAMPSGWPTDPLLCFFGCFIIVGFSPRHRVPRLDPMGSVNPSSEMRLA